MYVHVCFKQTYICQTAHKHRRFGGFYVCCMFLAVINRELRCPGTGICHPAHRGHFQTLHRNPLLSNKLHLFVKCFVFLKHFENTTSINQYTYNFLKSYLYMLFYFYYRGSSFISWNQKTENSILLHLKSCIIYFYYWPKGFLTRAACG